MSKPEWIARQSSHPRGWIGALVARLMALDSASVNDATLDRLAPKDGEAILEIGCGHGRSLQQLGTLTSKSRLVGIDPSTVMRKEARRRNALGIEAGRICIEDGHAAAIPFADGSFDAAFSVHTLYFWTDITSGLTEIRRILRGGGRALLVHRPLDDPKAATNLPASVYTLRSVAAVEKQLFECGFNSVQTEIRTDAKSLLAFTTARAGSNAV